MAQGRAKRPHQKVKTGCMTCRKRRIKCDEGKPACRQCTDSLRKCEGYQPPQTWLFKPRKVAETKQDTTTTNTTTAIVQFVSPLAPIGDSDDRRSFQFWVEQAAPIFSSYFGHSFWAELLPKIGVAQPAVKHMLLATSSVVEASALEGVPLEKNSVYQTHYTKAIQATCSSPQIESVLMACLLFACCEFMKGSVLPGLRHIQAGLNIIDEWVKSTRTSDLQLSPAAKLIVQAIAPIFLAYIDKAPTYGMGDLPINECACTTLVNTSAELPWVEHFTKIHRAHHALDGIGHHIARIMDYRRAQWRPSPPHKVQMLLESWRMHFETFESSRPDAQKQKYGLALQLLRVHYTMLSVMLRVSSSKHENVYEQYTEEFKWIVDKYDDFAELWAKDESSKFFTGMGNLEYHMGYIPPLFFTATKCRDPATRLAALKHLNSLRVVENNWTSCTAYLIARKIIKIENTRSINNKRTGLKDEHDLIRPVEAFITDKRSTQAGLNYLAFPYDSTPLLQDTLDLQSCPFAPSAQWPLCRIIRIGGYQGGGVRPLSTGCSCGIARSKEALILRPKTKV
ncbi:uncharacterized protein PV07_11755 [Cladophialophora immunda]|uniref:Zn(2)-C6 fungal-type domain-containing protein n=1 Tax=Cladophialophora immunda TaxID=569365 RepID=A0A0D2AFC2_9EURO|nr:uncharacterized protein PV07_11755 [Cladophialophora immunda]KIW23567.1 hypothetical protein PV07_11755 [Cladophialophora immunda]OQV09228.1 Fungal Zn2-Cys6 binuclear cluster domain-containing protein isoform 2 [Cladophialophora immunda]